MRRKNPRPSRSLMVAEIQQFPHIPTRAQIEALEMELAQHSGRIAIEPIHHFADGLYSRTIHIPANVCLTGKVHKTEHINIISAGEITVWTEAGMRRLSAPCVFVSQPGTKRAGWTHAPTVWTTIHANPTNEREIPKVDELFVEPENPALTEARTPCLS